MTSPTSATPVRALTSAFAAHDALLRGKLRLPSGEFELSPRHCEILSAMAVLGAVKGGVLAEELYPDCDPERARLRFKVYVHNIRRKIGQEAVSCAGGAYGLAAEIQLDFRNLERGSATPLETPHNEDEYQELLHLADSVEAFRYAVGRRAVDWEWFLAHSIRLNDLTHDVTIRICAALLLSGHPADVVRLADGLLSEDDFDEQAREVKLLALIATKQFARVLKEYRRYDKAMREELGIGAELSLRHLIGSVLTT